MAKIIDNQNFSGQFGSQFSQTPVISGTAGQWRVVSGALPPGLSLNASTGAITGTPSKRGTFSPSLDASRFVKFTGGNFSNDLFQIQHTLAGLTSTQEAFAWGSYTASTPQWTLENRLSGVSKLVAGSTHIVALTTSGRVAVLYDPLKTQNVPAMSGIIDIAAARDRSYAIKNDGLVFSWGKDFIYQRIIYGSGTYSFEEASTAQPPQPSSRNIKKIAVGEMGTIGLLGNGSVIDFLWDGTTIPSNNLNQTTRFPYNGVPYEIAANPAIKVVDIVAGGFQYGALLEDGSVIFWRRLETNDSPFFTGDQPNIINRASGITAIAATQSNFCALRSDGTLNHLGAAGPALTNVTAISSSTLHFFAHLANGATVAWAPGASFFDLAPSFIPNPPGTRINFNIGLGIPKITQNQTFQTNVGSGVFLNSTGRVALDDPQDRPATSFTGILPPGLTLSASTGQISGKAENAGTTTVAITASSSLGSDTRNISIVVGIGAPQIAANQTFSPKFGESFTFTPALVDSSDRPATVWRTAYLDNILPGGFTFNTATGAISGTATQRETYKISVAASNQTGDSPFVEVTIAVAAGTPALELESVIRGKKNIAFDYVLPNSQTRPITSWSATGLPAGLSLNSTTGRITGTPTSAGTSAVTITGTGAGGTNSATTSFEIYEAAVITTVPTINLVALGENTDTHATFTVTNELTAGVPSWSAINLPPGLRIEDDRLRGRVEIRGTFKFTLVASTFFGQTKTEVNLVIAPAKPQVARQSFKFIAQLESTTQQFDISADFLEAAPINSWAVNPAFVPFLPEWASITADGKLIILTGLSVSYAPFETLLQITGPGGTTNQYIDVSSTLPVPVIADGNFTANYAASFSFNLAVTNTSIFTWSVVGLPKWANFNAITGIISGTAAAAGTFSFTATATNGTGIGIKKLTFSILPGAPLLTSSTLRLATQRDYKKILVGIDNVNRPVTRWTAVGLPPGLFLSPEGVLSGAPTASGSFLVTITATGIGGSGSAIYTFEITESATVFSKASIGLIPQNDRSVDVFTSGLIRVTQTYVGLQQNASADRATIAAFNDLPGGNIAPADDVLKIWPEPQEKITKTGFIDYVVTAYGRINKNGYTRTFFSPGKLKIIYAYGDFSDPNNPLDYAEWQVSLDVMFENISKNFCTLATQTSLPYEMEIPLRVFTRTGDLLESVDVYGNTPDFLKTYQIRSAGSSPDLTNIKQSIVDAKIENYGPINEISVLYGASEITVSAGYYVKNAVVSQP